MHRYSRHLTILALSRRIGRLAPSSLGILALGSLASCTIDAGRDSDVADRADADPIGVEASDQHSDNGPTNTIDGDLKTRWSAKGDGQWIRYDLGTPQVVTALDIAWFKGDQRRASFDIEVGEHPDGPWTTVLSGQSSGTTLEPETHEVDETTGRYVRIVGHGNTATGSGAWNSITEVRIIGDDDGGPEPPPDGCEAVSGGDLRVFPGAEGFGTDTLAGRGGAVIRVTNLNDDGPGSLRRCAAQTSGPRTCVFEVGGVLSLDSDIDVKEPFLTVAGQTAPGSGILVRDATLRISTHDVLVQHMAFRVGDRAGGVNPDNRDSLKIEGGNIYNVVIDHVSASWATDETMSIWGTGIHDVTISNSIISEGLHDSLHSKGPHSKGLISGSAPGKKNPYRISLVGNLFAHNFERNPLTTEVAFVNNVVYNYQFRATAIRGGSAGHKNVIKASVVGNVYRKGHNSNDKRPVFIQDTVAAGSKVYLHDNQAVHFDGSDPYSIAEVAVGHSIETGTPQQIPPGLTIRPSAGTEQRVLTRAGARPARRDAVDARIVDEVTEGTGRRVDCVDGCRSGAHRAPGGYPSYPTKTRALSVPADPSGDDDGDGYTNVEEWIHGFTADVECG